MQGLLDEKNITAEFAAENKIIYEEVELTDAKKTKKVCR